MRELCTKWSRCNVEGVTTRTIFERVDRGNVSRRRVAVKDSSSAIPCQVPKRQSKRFLGRVPVQIYGRLEIPKSRRQAKLLPHAGTWHPRSFPTSRRKRNCKIQRINDWNVKVVVLGGRTCSVRNTGMRGSKGWKGLYNRG